MDKVLLDNSLAVALAQSLPGERLQTHFCGEAATRSTHRLFLTRSPSEPRPVHERRHVDAALQLGAARPGRQPLPASRLPLHRCAAVTQMRAQEGGDGPWMS